MRRAGNCTYKQRSVLCCAAPPALPESACRLAKAECCCRQVYFEVES